MYVYWFRSYEWISSIGVHSSYILHIIPKNIYFSRVTIMSVFEHSPKRCMKPASCELLLLKISLRKQADETNNVVNVFVFNVSSHTSNTYWELSDNHLLWISGSKLRLSWIPFGYLLFRHSITDCIGILNRLSCLYYILWISISHTVAKSKVKEYPDCQSLSGCRFNWERWGVENYPCRFEAVNHLVQC